MKKIILIFMSVLFVFMSFPITAYAEEKTIYSKDGDNCATNFLNLDWQTATSENLLEVILSIKNEFGVYSGKTHYLLMKDLKLTDENTEGAEIYYLLISQDAWRATDYKKNASDPYITCVRAFQPSIYIIFVNNDETSSYIVEPNYSSYWHTVFDGVWDTEDMVLTGDYWNWVGSYYTKDDIEYIYSTEAVESMGIYAGYTMPNSGGDSGSGEVEEEDEGVVGWLKSIFDSIKSIFDGVKENGGLLQTVANYLLNLYNGISSWFDELGVNLTKAIEDAVNTLGGLINDILSELFIPDEDYLTSKKEQLENSFSNLLGFEVSSVEAMFESVDTITEFKSGGSVSVYGVGNVNFNGVNNNLLMTGINKFKPIIRGFTALMLIFFNMNQLLNLIGQGSITQAIGLTNKQSKGGKE